MNADVYFKKEIMLRHAGQTLRLRVSQDLFSSYDVDTGTQRLLRSLLDIEMPPLARVLDLGCGYGPLGLALKAQDPRRAVHLVDRDALAVDYARQNALLNGLDGVECYASLGYDDLTAADFDLILMNVPAKAGPPVIAYLLQEAVHRLRPGGLVAIVVVSALAPLVSEILARPGIAVRRRRDWPGHTVWHYGFSQAPDRPTGSALERGVYDAGKVIVSWSGPEFALRTAHGLPDRDTMEPGTAMLLTGIGKLPEGATRRALVLNPGQGHGAVALWQRCRPDEIVLVDRDLLALRVSRMNLVQNGCPEDRVRLRHQAGAGPPSAEQADLIVGILREEEGPQAVAATVTWAAEQLAAGGSVLLAASSTAATRVVDMLESTRRLAVKRRTRSRGQSLLLLQRRDEPPRQP